MEAMTGALGHRGLQDIFGWTLARVCARSSVDVSPAGIGVVNRVVIGRDEKGEGLRSVDGGVVWSAALAEQSPHSIGDAGSGRLRDAGRSRFRTNGLMAGPKCKRVLGRWPIKGAFWS